MAITATTNFLLFFFLCSSFISTSSCHHFSRSLSHEEITRRDILKHTHLHFYFHDVVTGHNPTAVRVAQAPGVTTSSDSKFGLVVVADDVLTLGPKIDSKAVGRGQGLFASADKIELGLLMLFNFVFTEGEFNRSTLTMIGRNSIRSPVREMSVVGGSGAFRHARGYAEARTYEANRETFNAVVEYNVYVSY